MSQVPRRRVSRILWAIDPFEDDLVFDQTTIEELNRWATDHKTTIEPVYVFTPFSDIELLASDKIAEKMANLFFQCGLTTAPATVLHNRDHLTIRAVHCLLSYAEETKADLIIVSSHGRRGIKRMLFGSFAEALLLESPIPILFMNQKKRDAGSARIGRVLWATDFSSDGKLAFQAFQEQFKGCCREIVLFHDMSLPFDIRAFFSEFDSGVPLKEDLFSRQKEWAEKQAADWLNQAKENGNRCETLIEMGYAKIATEIMATAAQKQVGWIAMVSRSNAFEAVLFGSHAREVFRSSQFPVLVYGPRFCELAQGEVSHASNS